MPGDVQATAAAELQAAGLAVGRVTTVVDLTCQYIGVVKTQSPAAGLLRPARHRRQPGHRPGGRPVSRRPTSGP